MRPGRSGAHSGKPDVASDGFDHVVHLPGERLLGEAEGVFLRGLSGYVRGQGKGISVYDHVDHDGTAAFMPERGLQAVTDVAWFGDPDACCAEAFGDAAEVGVHEVRTERDESGLLL